MRALLIDNHDSYTYNLFQLMAEVYGVEPVVVPNDDPRLADDSADSWVAAFDGVVVSPGPGRPQVGRDVGRLAGLLGRVAVPVLGVCLGHQLIAHLAGGVVDAAPRARHGHLSRVRHDGDALFAGVPTEFTAVRYHSLCVREPLPEALQATAWAEDGVVMALRHRKLPRWGVQFHPESVATTYGRELLANFRTLSLRARGGGGGTAPAGGGPAGDVAGAARAGVGLPGVGLPGAAVAWEVSTAVVPWEVDAGTVFAELFAGAPACFWLDSSRPDGTNGGEGRRAGAGLARFSFLGDASGPTGEVLTYHVGTGTVRVERSDGASTEAGSILDVLARRLRERRVADPGLPFDLVGGYVGYFGYEMKAETGGASRHQAPSPDAAWIFADRLIAVDHAQRRTHIVAVHAPQPTARAAARHWTAATAARLRQLPTGTPAHGGDGPPTAGDRAAPEVGHDRGRYLAAVEECRRELLRGESYEICLTTSVRLPFHEDDLAFYRRLRRANPAPYAALLRVGGVTVFSSSPERFLRVDRNGRVESRPIKGTAPRSTDPERDAALAAALALDPKTRAENLMITDLLRNDLGRVCQIGSVRVDRLLAVESYATVHQLVSTIQGWLRPDADAVDCVRACFPGGSMTGAPKQRTMEIIDRLEDGPRGVYSGALGWFGLTGAADLSIVIRAAIRAGDHITVGAGGAVVLDSDPAAEYDEMRLKAAAVLRAVRTVTAAGLGQLDQQ